MTLLAAYQTLLARYTQQEDIVVGVPIANRNRNELEGLIGFFVNSLVMRTDLSGAPTFIELLARVREVALGAYTHQDIPFEMILETMQFERTLSHNPLFQVVFTMANTPGETQELKGLSVGPFGGEIETEKFDLTLRINEAEAGLQVSLGYNTDIFDAGRISRMASHFKNLLASIAAYPESRLGALTLLDEAESRQVLYDWNPQISGASAATIHLLFQRQAASRPDSVAISCADLNITYSSLDRRANQLARFLRRHGVGPEQIVALMFERTEEAILSMLAVLKAGGAYLPLDSASPAPRLQGMLQDASVKLVLTHHALAERAASAASDAGAQVLSLERQQQAIGRESHDAPDDVAAPDNLAYVIYTSGSTGRPKGVAVSHANLTRLFTATRRQFSFSSQDV
jgi:non-ribosomal peptide synthetase component F